MSEENIRRLWPSWERDSLKITELKGGIVNTSYVVKIDGEAYVVRVPGKNTELYFDREIERENMELLAKGGIAPELVEFRKDDKIIIREFIEGTVATKESFKDPDTRRKAISAIRQLHESEIRLSNDFNVFVEIRRYRDLLRPYSDRVLADYPVDRLCELTRSIEKELSKQSEIRLACHNDLLPANFILADEGVRIIDWEYSGMNDPCYDIANHIAELDNIDEEEEEHILGLYFGEEIDQKRVTVDLYKLPSRLLWGFWGLIQRNVSDMGFDFESWARHQLDQALHHAHMLETKYPHILAI